jgi:hypothetical protein
MMPYVVYTASLGDWSISMDAVASVDDADFEELQIAIAVPDPGMNNPLHYQQQAVLPIV